jgi:hypothetical protein
MVDKETKTEELLTIAKSKLDIHGMVEFQQDSQLGFPAVTSSNNDCSHHLIQYKGQISVGTLFHEVCHVKLNEIGFKKVELRIAKNTDEATKIALMLVAEAYADSLSLKFFNEECEDVKDLDSCYLLPNSVLNGIKNSKNVTNRLLFIGMAPAYIIAEKWNGHNLEKAIRATFQEALGKSKNLEAFNEILMIMSNLPSIKVNNSSIIQFSNEDLDLVFNAVTELIKTLMSE